MKATYILFAFLALFGSCCDKNEDEMGGLPDCIEDIVKNQELSKHLLTVQIQTVNNDAHYWLNTGSTSFDGIEYIVNNQCDTVCIMCGECLPPPCSGDYKHEDWVVIWKKK